MEICIVTHKITPGDGQGRVNYEITLEALRRGHTLKLISSYIHPSLRHEKNVKHFPIGVDRCPNTLLRNLMFSRQSSRYLTEKDFGYDILLSNGAITSVPSDINIVHFVHSAWLKSPYHTVHSRRDVYGFYQWLYTALNSRWEKQAFQATRTIVAVSNQVKRELIKLGISATKIKVVTNGVNPSEFQDDSVSRLNLGLPEDVVLGLFAGDIRTPRKNLDAVLKALVHVPDFYLVVAGDTSGSPYPAMAVALGIQDRTYFLGYSPNIPQLMRASDLFVFPSHYETFGLVILEAMASGLPVITTQATGASELLKEESGIVLLDSKDVEALTASLTKLVRSPQTRKKMGQKAREVAGKHRWEKVASSYVNLMESMMLRQREISQ